MSMPRSHPSARATRRTTGRAGRRRRRRLRHVLGEGQLETDGNVISFMAASLRQRSRGHIAAIPKPPPPSFPDPLRGRSRRRPSACPPAALGRQRPRQLAARADPELAVGVAEVDLDGLRRHEERLGDRRGSSCPPAARSATRRSLAVSELHAAAARRGAGATPAACSSVRTCSASGAAPHTLGQLERAAQRLARVGRAAGRRRSAGRARPAPWRARAAPASPSSTSTASCELLEALVAPERARARAAPGRPSGGAPQARASSSSRRASSSASRGVRGGRAPPPSASATGSQPGWG